MVGAQSVSRVADFLVVGLFGFAAVGLLVLAPTDDLMRTVAYVLLVECPALVVLVMGIHAYLDWRSR